MLPDGRMQPTIFAAHACTVAALDVEKLHRNFHHHPVKREQHIEWLSGVSRLPLAAGIVPSSMILPDDRIHAAPRCWNKTLL